MTNVKNIRESNIELFRIITMLLIVAHHFVVNSGLTEVMMEDPLSWKSTALYIIGAFGKTGINCFVLITGYFMCKSPITLRKYCKLLFEVYFYNTVIYIIFLLTGYETICGSTLLKLIFPISELTYGFTSCFLVFYLTIPFLTILVNHLTERQHLKLILLIVAFFILFACVPWFSIGYSYVSWFICLFFIASYFRLYPRKIFDNNRMWGGISLLMICLSCGSVIALNWISVNVIDLGAYFLLADSNKILAVATACSCFLYFKNLKIKPSRFINTVASSTFGVLMIHANSDAMRQWLWKDLLRNAEMYSSDWIILYAIVCVVGVFSVCVVIDQCRIRFVERPFFVWWDKASEKLIYRYRETEERICRKYDIG